MVRSEETAAEISRRDCRQELGLLHPWTHAGNSWPSMTQKTHLCLWTKPGHLGCVIGISHSHEWANRWAALTSTSDCFLARISAESAPYSEGKNSERDNSSNRNESTIGWVNMHLSTPYTLGPGWAQETHRRRREGLCSWDAHSALGKADT